MSETGTGGACSDGVALDVAQSVAVSPDGRNVYVASVLSSAVTLFDRDPTTGALTQKAGTAGCVSETGTGGLCADGVGLTAAFFVASSPDGRNVYAGAGALVVFDRDLSTGELTQKAGLEGCISDDGTGGSCTDGTAIAGAREAAVSPDGRSVYLASSNNDAVAVFDRDPSTGALTQKAGMAGCVSQLLGSCTLGVALDSAASLAVSPDGLSVYVAASGSDAVAVFDRDLGTGVLTQKAGTAGCVSETGTGGACADGVGLDGASSVAVSPDGRSVYVAARTSDAVAVFDRDVETGALTQKAGPAGCVSDTGTGGACADGVALDDAISVAVSPDGRSVYAASTVSHAVAAFDRDLVTGALMQKAGTAGCVSDTGTMNACTDGVALEGARHVAMAPDGRSVYVAAGLADAVAAFAREVPVYDIDGDGEVQALVDGLLLLRYFFNLRGAALVSGAVDLANCTRCTAAQIEAYIQALLGL